MTIKNSEIKEHVGHDIECVVYGDGANHAIECNTCGMVLFDDENTAEDFTRTIK